MKELTIEQKAQRYDEAIEKLRNFYRDYNTVSHLIDVKEELANLIPELKESKESEDDRIRKHLITLFKDEYGEKSNARFAGIKVKDIIAWLEKQGEQKTINKIQFGKKYKCIASPRYSAFMTGEIYKPEDKFLCSLMNLCYDCFEPVEDGEQKSNDKVKPKFKVGDWIVYKDTVWKVYNISLLNYYELLKINNEVSTISVEDVDKSAHLWTVQDVRNGDVLVDGDNNIGLYREEKDDIYWESYIYLGVDGELRGFNTGGYHRNENTKPATKEQRNALFAKMKEAGFKWVAELVDKINI